MSMANECDLCGALYVPARGVVHIEQINVGMNATGLANTWSDIDFCRDCSLKLLAVIGPSMNDLPKYATQRAKKK